MCASHMGKHVKMKAQPMQSEAQREQTLRIKEIETDTPGGG